MKKVSDFVFDFIADLGVKHVFMLPGGGAMHLVDSLGRNKKLKYICNLHEQACSIAAEAYGQYTNNLGVALVTAGPGSTNAITGVAGAWIDSTPILVISGQAKVEDMMTGRNIRQMGIQEVDIESIVKPITKYAVCIKNPEEIKYHLQKAAYLARNGRKGPVWVDIPLDVQGAMVDENKIKNFNASEEFSIPKNEKLLQIADSILKLISESKRPVILVGNGIRLSDSISKFVELMEKLNIPVLTSWKAADFLPEDHPLFCGRPGIIASRGANFTQQFSDCLIIMGTRLDLCQTGFNHHNFAKNAKKIIIDIDENEINKLDMKFEIKYIGDVKKIIEELDRQSSARKQIAGHESWLKKCKEWLRKYPVVLPEYKNGKGLVNTYHLIDVISELSDENDIFVPASSGAPAELTLQAIKIKKGQRLQNTPGLGAMGFDLPACIGACIASGGRRTICLVGDGGIQMNIQELQTLENLGLPIKIFVLNNGGYGSIVNMQKGRFNSNFVASNKESGLVLPDICKIAEAYGLKTCRIKSQKKLKEEVNKVLSMHGTVICDVMVDPNVQTAPRLSSEVMPDGRIVSKPMEDLWPFLEREELRQILLTT